MFITRNESCSLQVISAKKLETSENAVFETQFRNLFFFFHEKSCFLLEIFSLTIWNHPIYFGTCDRPWWERCVIALTRVRTRHIKNTLAVCHTTKILYVFRHLLMIHPFPTRINWCLSIFNFYSFIWLLLVFSVPVIC